MRALPKVLAPLVLVLILAAGIWRLWDSGAWERQQRTAWLLGHLDLPASEAVANEWLLVGKMPEPAAGEAGCARLWSSRALAAADLEAAAALVEDANSCNRADDYFGWVGNLAWRQENPDRALTAWRQVSAGKRLAWGIYQLRIEQVEKGRLLLGDLVQSQELTAVQQAQLNQALGDSFHIAGEVEQAAVFYQQAWELGGPDYRLAHNLGKVLGRLGRCEEAVRFMEQGLVSSNAAVPPSLAADYFLELARCYQQLGTADEAEASLRNVDQLLSDPALSAQERETLRVRLEQLRSTG